LRHSEAARRAWCRTTGIASNGMPSPSTERSNAMSLQSSGFELPQYWYSRMVLKLILADGLPVN
jgi:hypothetical protein